MGKIINLTRHKIMKKLFLTLFATSLGLISSGQTFTGTVTDTTGDPLIMAGIALLNPDDSTMASFGITNDVGYFETTPVGDGEYIFQVSFLGFQTYNRDVTVGEGGTASNLGNIQMAPEMNSLSEVVINGQRIPVLINKDTVEYDASSFRVRADDNVEDLLKRLPGIEVDRDGSITAQGQDVEQVLVDGKEFFGGDPTIATRNIPADAVKSVQVYDRQTDDAMYTGVDDGERSKTINLELKEDRKKGYFGYAEGGAGYADDRIPFTGKTGVHSFTNTTRVSVLGNFNNVNDYGFSFGDYRDMSGGGGMGRGGYMITVDGSESIPLNFAGPDDGLFLSGATGVNLNWDPNRNHRFNASYFFTHLDNFTTTTENSREFAGDTEITGFRESEDNSISNSHSFSINHRSDLDSMNRVEVKASGRYQVGFSGSTIYEQRTIDGIGTLQESNRQTNSEDVNTAANLGVNYIHKFNNEGRILALRTSAVFENVESDGTWENYNQFPLDNEVDSLFQQRNDLTSNTRYNGSVEYTEPLAKKHFLTVSGNFSVADEQLDRTTFDVYSGGFQDIYSPNFFLSEGYQGGEVAYKYTGDVHNVSVSLRGTNYYQSAIEERFETTIPQRSFFYLLPGIDYNWSISNFSRASFNYNSSVQMPELTQLLTLEDITNPLVTFIGNPDLEPQFRQSVWMNYGFWNSFDGSGFFAYLSGGRTDNVISTDQTIDSQYVRIFRPENFSEPAYNFNSAVNYRFSISKIGIDIRTQANGSYRTTPSKINGEVNMQDNSSVGGELSFRNSNREVIEVNIGGRLNYNWSTYSLQTQLNQEYLSHSYFANFEYSVNEQLEFETGVDIQTYTNAQFAEDQVVPVWNANISYNLVKDGTAQLQLTVFDILNQNRGVSRFGNLNSIVERNTNSLGRYAMVTFLYKFNSGSAGGGGGGERLGERVTITR
ncbi:outer membrane beta-barrel protein [Phaeocystidibacter luteus]|uniref:Outer membrane beta-barrel protein n=2 Tax=Phaeocystidibacter luteus TaxID=911197 RepID=A0A6N6RM66_9FLAO|nr:outer membrane beta-barrel protein [Phaeocystidibacter luteus]